MGRDLLVATWRYVRQFDLVPCLGGLDTYEIDMTANAAWSGQVTRFRLDPATASALELQIEYISVTPSCRRPNLDPSHIVNSSQPVFQWDVPVENQHSGITYNFQLADNCEMTNPLISVTGLPSNTYTYGGSPVLDGDCWWRVRAVDNAGNVSPWCIPMPIYLRVWGFDTGEELVGINNFGTATVANGIWSAVTTGSDPFFTFYNGNSPINANVYKGFRMTIKLSGRAASPARNSSRSQSGWLIHLRLLHPDR